MSNKHPYENAVDPSQVNMNSGRINKVATTLFLPMLCERM